MTYLTLESLYVNGTNSYMRFRFDKWNILINLRDLNNFLKLNIIGEVCLKIHNYEVHIHCYYKHPSFPFNKVDNGLVTNAIFDMMVDQTKKVLKNIS